MNTVGLISCVSSKRAKASMAAELYRSPLFKKARAFIESRCEKWYILSAKYGLVEPGQLIEPYDDTLKAKPQSERRQWAQNVWKELRHKLSVGDHVVILAGERYREYLVPELARFGCSVEVPLKSFGIGRQLQWLSHKTPPSTTRQKDLDRLYRALDRLEKEIGGKRTMANCTGEQSWPHSGIYLFLEPNEYRTDGTELRIVRVGTHGVSRGSRATLWNRLRTHRGGSDGSGNHRGSIFRLHVGAALSARDRSLAVPSWGIGQSANAVIRRKEDRLERAVSQYIGTMQIIWLAINDDSSPTSDRAYLERNIIGLLVGESGPIDRPSRGWLGEFSPNKRIRKSGLWNLQFLDYSYSPDFLDILDEYVAITIGQKPNPLHSIAPHDWYSKAKNNLLRRQLPLFKE